ncbi:DUF4062 domain-containing protein, partial [Salipiger mucosus]|uniref:DUF4062 domain-containing protein n=1 Tax=Salipiger mucosus TaxID=263378 RepID=UPI00055F33C6
MTRIFISSTFRDMQDERDILARRVLPRLRAEVPGAAHLVEIDLRWGLTRAMTADGGAVRLCLEGVDAAHGVLGMIGARTGWQPDPSFLRAFDRAFAGTLPGPCGLTELELRRAFAKARSGTAPLPRILIAERARTAETAPLVDWLEAHHPERLALYDTPERFEQAAHAALTDLLSAAQGHHPQPDPAPQVARPQAEATLARALRPPWLRR